jgi:2-oxoisovalerate dehydrogenase E1 component alpha subunit
MLSRSLRRSGALALPRRSRRACSNISRFVGAQSEYTRTLKFLYPHVDSLPPAFPAFRLIDDAGVPVDGAVLPEIDSEKMRQMQKTMIRVSEFDKVFNDAQRQGRLSFYFTNRGEEACSVGSGAALQDNDWVWPQYRELGATFWRGYTIEQAANQCCHNELDATKGRQLPMHIGSPDKCLMYVKSNLGQQVRRGASLTLHWAWWGVGVWEREGCGARRGQPSTRGSTLHARAPHTLPGVVVVVVVDGDMVG